MCISFAQALNTLTQECADDERVEENPWAIRYPDRAPSEKQHILKELTRIDISVKLPIVCV